MILKDRCKLSILIFFITCSAQADWRDYLAVQRWSNISSRTKAIVALATTLAALGVFEWQTNYFRQRLGLCVPQKPLSQESPHQIYQSANSVVNVQPAALLLSPSSSSSVQAAGPSAQKPTINMSQFSSATKYFLGAYIPEDQNKEILNLQNNINDTINLRATVPALLHMTIRFIGTFEQAAQAIQKQTKNSGTPADVYKSVMQTFAQGFIEDDSISVTFDKLGFFGKNKDILVLQASTTPDSLKNLRSSVHEKLSALNMPQETVSSFTPHISLGSIAKAAQNAQALEQLKIMQIDPITITFNSVQIGGGKTDPIDLPLQIKQ